MKTNKFVKTGILEENITYEYIKAINGLLELPGKELDLLVLLINLDIDFKPSEEGEPKNIANTKNRKFLMKELGMTRDNLSTYIRRLREKGLLIKDGPDKLYVRDELKPVLVRDTVQITFILKTDKR